MAEYLRKTTDSLKGPYPPIVPSPTEPEIGLERRALIGQMPTRMKDLRLAGGFLKAYQASRASGGPRVTQSEQTWWLHLVRVVRDSRAEPEAKEKAIARLISVMQRVSDEDEGRKALSDRIQPSRMRDAIDQARRALEPPPTRVPPPASPGEHGYSEQSRFYRKGGLGSSGFVWIGNSAGPVSPPIGSDFVATRSGTLVAVPSGKWPR